MRRLCFFNGNGMGKALDKTGKIVYNNRRLQSA